jgi:hypothetical protein
MKYLVTLFLFIPLFFASRNASAFSPMIDSVYADSCYQDGIYGVSSADSARMFHKFDDQFGQLTGNGPQIDLAFKKYKSNAIQAIKPGSTILVWGKKDKTVDSSAGKLTFNIFDESLQMLVTSSATILGDGIQTVTVPQVPGNPNGHWDYIELSLSGDLVKHATSYFIDAVALVQDTTTPPKSVSSQPLLVNSISSYPNPFVQNTTIHFELESGGDIEISVIDALGREVSHEQAGYLDNGIQEIPLAIKTSGIYFVRLFVNGQPNGNPLKINAR